METIDHLHTIFNEALANICWQKKQPQNLYEPIDYTLSSGGKRLRPVLVLLAYSLYISETDNYTDATNAALAIEFFHNFTLMHDDVMDNADLRRGKPTVHKKWNSNAAILSGDELLIEAYSQLAKIPDEKLKKCLLFFNEMASNICQGQQYDMDFETREDVTVDEYINMIKLKTSVLIGTALKIGACLADAPEKDIEYLGIYGTNLGIAFQLQDDNLDVYGDTKTFGKNIGGDILCNKKTFLLLTALEKADPQQKTALEALLTNAEIQPADKIAQVKKIYDEIRVKELAIAAMQQYTDKALNTIKQTSLSHEKQQILVDLANQLLNRQS